jgi:site-specific DNA recombinase
MTEENTQLRVAIYLRVSTDDQADKYGLDLQREAVESLIKSKGHLEDGSPRAVLAGTQYVYVDDGVSGTTDIGSRPGFSRLIEDLIQAPEGKKPFNVVAVYRIDRFARKLKILMDVIDLFNQHGVKLLSANESIDTSTPFGRAILSIIGVIAELEIETMKQRTQDGRRQAVQKGVVMGENATYGFIKNPDKTARVLEPEAKVVRMIFNLFITESKTPQTIADELRRLQVLSPSSSAVFHQKRKGRPKKKNDPYFWRDLQVREILSNEMYIGVHYYHKYKDGTRLPKTEWKRSDFAYPTIIEKITFEMAQRRLEKLKTINTNVAREIKSQHIYLLSGLLKCEDCLISGRSEEMPSWVGESRKVTTLDGETISYMYKCGRRNSKKFSNTCSAIPLPGDQVENIVLEQVRQLLDNPEPVIRYQNKLKSDMLEKNHLLEKQSRLLDLIEGTPDRKKRLQEQHLAGIITSVAALKLQMNEEDQKIESWKKEVADIEVKIGNITLSKQYTDVFTYFQNKYYDSLSDLKNNPRFTHDLLESLIEKVVVRSRKVEESDVISGKKKKEQVLPHKLDIYFRLPKDILQELFFKFGVKDANL